MPISIKDNLTKINNVVMNNIFTNCIFSNIIMVSILIVIINIMILYYNINYEEDINLAKIFVWSLLSTSILLLLHNKTIKLTYIEKTKKEGSEEFKNMMENNTNALIGQSEIAGRNELESDIIKFLDR